MNEISAFLITVMTALFGSFLAKKCRFPASAMTGAILSVAILNCITGRATVGQFTKPCMQIMGGALLGHNISRNDLKKINEMIKAAAVLVIAMFLLNMTTGLGVYRLTNMNLATALLATAPGGVSDMALIAEDFGADMRIVSILQLYRMFGIYLIFPPVLRYVQKRKERTGEPFLDERAEKKERLDPEKGKNCFFTLVVAFGGGCLVELFGMPAGFMVGSVASCAIMNICTERGHIPKNWRFFIQSVTGAVIGCQMTKESLMLLKQLMLPVICMICGMLLFTFLFGGIMSRVSKLDFQTSLLCLTPGGIQETSLLAADVGCDVSSVIVMHTVRLVVVICIFPMILSMFTGRLGGL